MQIGVMFLLLVTQCPWIGKLPGQPEPLQDCALAACLQIQDTILTAKVDSILRPFCMPAKVHDWWVESLLFFAFLQATDLL